jgi:hypothetical protein
MPPPQEAASRPRTVTAAFWCWVVAAVLTAAFGLFMVSLSAAPTFIRGAGGVLVVVGLGQAYLAGRARKGQLRFANAGVGLALASVVFCVLLLLTIGDGVITYAVIMALLITGTVLIRRESAAAWFESQGAA